MFLGEDAPFLLSGGRAEGLRLGSPRKSPPRWTQRLALTSKPRLGCADSDLLGRDLRDPRSALRLRRVSAPLPPATRGAPWLRRAAPANQRCRPRPSLAPQPMSTPATGHRPREEGEGGAGAESGLRGRRSRGPAGGTARAGSEAWGGGRGGPGPSSSPRRAYLMEGGELVFKRGTALLVDLT